MIAGRKAGGDLVTSVDSMVEYNELQLVRYSEAAIRKIRAEEQRRRENMMRGGASSFTDKVTAAEQSSEWNPRSVRTRFATGDHKLEEKANDSTQTQWTPDRGIIE